MHEVLDIVILVCLGILFAIPIFPIVAGLLWLVSTLISSVPFSWIIVGIVSFILGIFVSGLILSD